MKYWSNLAKLTNTWRSGSNAKKVFQAWQDLHGAAQAKRCAGGLPPRALRGRWGSKSNAERFFLRCAREPLAAVLQKLFPPELPNDRPLGHENDPEDLELGMLDPDEKTHGKRNHRWAHEAVNAVRSSEFWCQMYVGYTAAQPAYHISNWLKVTASATSDEAQRLPKIIDLVTGKVALGEFI